VAIDRVLLEVLRNHYQAIVEDMARIMERTAYTTFVKETADFCPGLVSNSGEYVSYPWRLGASSYLGLNLKSALDYFDEYSEGDIIICNDPYLSGPLCTHLPDIHILKPIFHEGEIICWGYVFIHSSDMGGTVPASVWPKASEVFQEGLRLRPLKLYKAGELNQELVNVIMDNCRIPEMNWGDIKAMIASVNSCERRIREMITKFGLETVVEGMDAVLDYAEARARTTLERIPDGTYEFYDYLEDDLISDVPVRIKVAMTVSGSDVHLDFTGTDPQVSSALNIASHGVTHPFLCEAMIAYIITEDMEIPKASSVLRPVKVTAPSGSVLNSQFPAAMGVRYATAFRVFDAVLGALALALPGRIPAAPAGASSPVVAAIMEPLTGMRHVQVVEPMLGGGGGREGLDGPSACDSTVGFLRNTPVESIEAEVPIVMRRYHLLPDTGGAGKYRGGLAVRLDFQVHHPNSIVTARSLERFKLQPWGVGGGKAGTTGSCFVNRDSENPKEIGKVDVLHLEPGDTVSIFSPAGGGFGDPRDRDPALVLEDVRSGFVSAANARSKYGVVVDGDKLDSAATEQARAAMAPSTDAFDYGERRAELERRWPPAIQDAMVLVLEEVPPSVRDWGKHRIYERIQAIAQERPPVVADVHDAWAALRGHLSRALEAKASTT
jgi:N-methylhydantoinase B